MKKQVVTFIVGLLIGAIIATGSMVAYTKLTVNNNQGTPPSMSQSGSDSQNGSQQGGQPPEMPNGQGGDSNSNDQNQDNSNTQNSQGGTSSSGTSTTAA